MTLTRIFITSELCTRKKTLTRIFITSELCTRKKLFPCNGLAPCSRSLHRDYAKVSQDDFSLYLCLSKFRYIVNISLYLCRSFERTTPIFFQPSDNIRRRAGTRFMEEKAELFLLATTYSLPQIINFSSSVNKKNLAPHIQFFRGRL